MFAVIASRLRRSNLIMGLLRAIALAMTVNYLKPTRIADYAFSQESCIFN